MDSMRDELDEERETIRQLREELVPALGRPEYLALKLTRSECAILESLRKARGLVAKSSLLYRLDIANNHSAASDNSLKVHINRLRAKLGALDPPIRIGLAYGLGYYLTPEDKAWLEALAG